MDYSLPTPDFYSNIDDLPQKIFAKNMIEVKHTRKNILNTMVFIFD